MTHSYIIYVLEVEQPQVYYATYNNNMSVVHA